MEKIKLGISSCLLGEKVRYDGQHKRDHFLADIMSRYVEWVPICPEHDCGMSIPREAMHLEGDCNSPRLITVKTHRDLTDQMVSWAEKRLDELAAEDLCGYVFKSKSPSSGRFNVKVYNEHGIPEKKGTGIFAGMFNHRFPLLPQEEEGRLHDGMLRDNFITKVFACRRWRDYLKNDGSISGLVNFHTKYKYILMAHSPEGLNESGQLIAANNGNNLEEIKESYYRCFMQSLDQRATVKKNHNTLLHVMGYFKNDLTGWEKQELLDIIDLFAKELTPSLTPLIILRHYARKYKCQYLLEQYYVNPSPEEIMLRYHT
ncbi:DUF523 and DUF1722 domain-containing protein [Lentisphaerota bacterium ZTH]|nr:DUF523 and DUF1722 domain-containing protein [Lentisphaerota bacterium]WET06101.1 DUF523 and DUF1722 domain-containing protein [Lentisphaerota bacterium ZTH]